MIQLEIKKEKRKFLIMKTHYYNQMIIHLKIIIVKIKQ